MNDDSADLDRLFTRLSDEGRAPDPDDHPAPETLSAYLANELSSEEYGAIQEHLAHCTLCTELLLDLQRFLDPPWEDLPREGVVDFETVAEWRELRGRMGVGAGAREVSRPSRLRRVFGVGKWQAVAALLAFGIGIMSVYLLHLRSELMGPQGAIPLSLDSELGERSGNQSIKEIVLPGEDKIVSVWLTINSEPSAPSYRATILRTADKLKVSVRDVDYYPREGFALTIRSGSLIPGVYEISVEGLEHGRAKRLGLYHFKVSRH